MSGGTEVQRRVLLAGGTEEDAAALARALGGRWVLERTASQEPPPDPGPLGHDLLTAVLVTRPAPGLLARWRAALSAALAPAGLVALADGPVRDVGADWLDEGADDLVFRDEALRLPLVLRRLERDGAERARRARAEERWRVNTAELLSLARGAQLEDRDLEGTAREVTAAGATSLGVDRCSVWLLDEAKRELALVDRFEPPTGRHTQGERLAAREERSTLAALLAHRLVATADTERDPRLASVARRGLRSAMAVALTLKGDLVGALLFEHAAPRQWSAADETYAAALAEVLTLALESSERRKLEWALAQAERRFQDLFVHTSDATVLYRVALDGAVFCEDLNPAAEQATGLKRDNVIGRRVSEVLEPASASKLDERHAQAISARSAIVYEHDLTLPSGTRRFNTAIVPLLDELGRVQRLAAIARDVTAQRTGEDRRRRAELEGADAQKHESLARLGAHLARAVEGLLDAIGAQAKRLADSAPDASRAILETTARGYELTRDLLALGSSPPRQHRPVELGALVSATTRLLEPAASGVRVRVEVPAHPLRVMGDEEQLRQALAHLYTNGLDALGPPGGQERTLTVSLTEVVVKEPLSAERPPLRPGRWVRLSVSDTGRGLDAPSARRVFEPFFPAREGRAGSLGLALVEGAVRGHGGTVAVDSAPGLGSTYHLYLPAAERDEAQPGLGQHVMLVDDHPGMARVSAKLLETLGYQTSVFDDPREALAAFRARPQDFDVVMTDLSMPQMSGEELSRSLREVTPTVPVIVSSGMASEADRDELRRRGFSGVLLKPWRLEEAVAALRQACADGARATEADRR